MTIVTLLICLGALLLALLVAARPSRHLSLLTKHDHRADPPSMLSGFVELAEPAPDESPEQSQMIADGMA